MMSDLPIEKTLFPKPAGDQDDAKRTESSSGPSDPRGPHNGEAVSAEDNDVTKPNYRPLAERHPSAEDIIVDPRAGS
jgi:hypothetical protein